MRLRRHQRQRLRYLEYQSFQAAWTPTRTPALRAAPAPAYAGTNDCANADTSGSAYASSNISAHSSTDADTDALA